jgi:antitoxin component of MazEF toxin-antitoxin module
LAGCVALAVSLALIRTGGAYRGMIIPLALVGVIQLVVGSTVFLRTDAQSAAVQARVREMPAVTRVDETARMEKVMAAFRLYKVIEIAVLAGGILLAFAFPAGSAWYAAGIGCIIQGSVMLVLDLFAEARGLAYMATLAQIS